MQVPSFSNMISKILFHRSRCLDAVNETHEAISDLKLAQSVNASADKVRNYIKLYVLYLLRYLYYFGYEISN